MEGYKHFELGAKHKALVLYTRSSLIGDLVLSHCTQDRAPIAELSLEMRCVDKSIEIRLALAHPNKGVLGLLAGPKGGTTP